MAESPSSDVNTRLMQLEETLAFQDRLVEEFHHLLLAMQGELRAMTLRVERLERRCENLSNDEQEVRDPHWERPPHY